MNSVRIGTRGSILALAQANWVKKRLEERKPDLKVELVLIKTSGDRFVDSPVQAIGGKGFFVKEIEDALLQKEVDLAVHSMKDLPTEIAAGLAIAAVPEREDPRDALVSRNGLKLIGLPKGSRLGTGSLRRKAQLLHYRSDLAVIPIRGNVDTRLRKLDAGEVDAIILAAAGLKRIAQQERITEYVASEVCMSAVAQGALAVEAREDDALRDELAFLHHPKTFAEVSAERAFLDRLGGGCHVPVGARATVSGERLELAGVVAYPDGRQLCRGEMSGMVARASELGIELAERLLSEGAASILAASEQMK